MEYAFEAEVTEPGKLLVSTMYAGYHIVVVWTLLSSWFFAALALVGLLALGRVCLYFREHPESFGIVGAVLFHIGVDCGVVGVFALQYYDL